MPHCRRLVPLLALVLVIQSLVTVLPHNHHPTVEGLMWQAPSSAGALHHCLACSVYAPVVELAAESGHETGTVVELASTVEGGSPGVAFHISSAHPRGPPPVV